MAWTWAHKPTLSAQRWNKKNLHAEPLVNRRFDWTTVLKQTLLWPRMKIRICLLWSHRCTAAPCFRSVIAWNFKNRRHKLIQDCFCSSNVTHFLAEMVLHKPTKLWNKCCVPEPLHLNEILARMVLQGIPPFTEVYAALLAQFNPKIDNKKVSCSWDKSTLQLTASLITSMCIQPVFFITLLFMVIWTSDK